MPYRVALEGGFHPSGKRTYWTAERWLFFDSLERFLSTVETLKGKHLLFFATFEGGYPLLKLPERESELPPFGLAVLKEAKPFKGMGSFKVEPPSVSLRKKEYLKRFRKIKGYIERGDIYQVNFTVRFDFSFEGDPLSLWERFVGFQPVPYGVYFETPYFTLIGGSMELFLKREGKLLKSSPIKGTIPSDRPTKELLNSEKELAENLMITDMVRNDLSRVAEVGSVRVESLFKVENYRTVKQLVSTVVCKSDRSFGEILRATFPPASVSGAPKRRAVEIIAELEPHTREVYCGSVGLILPNGDFTANVSIRSAILKEGTLSYYAGGGIVYDSEGEREWREVLLKAEAFLKSLR